MQNGLIHIYFGDGKGKTTAAFGLALRAAGRKKKALISQFLKSADSGERIAVDLIEGITLMPCLDKVSFACDMDEQEKQDMHIYYTSQLKRADELARLGQYDMLILDEVLPAVETGLIEKEVLLEIMDNKPQELELVLTGRCSDSEILDRADYLSEIKELRHPFKDGVKARLGIEK